MTPDGRPRPEIAQRLQAVDKVFATAKRTPIRDRMDPWPDAERGPADRDAPRASARHL
jgi:hypothetical protein